MPDGEKDNMSVLLKPIKPQRISDQVFEQLRELIFRRELKPGEKMMPERELATALNVSRTTVRDAINKLAAIGLIEQKQGQGTFVCQPDNRGAGFLAEAMKSQNATLEDLLEVRMGLECNTAALAARRATEKDLVFMSEKIKEMGEAVKSGRLGSQADVSFHMSITYASKNPVQIFLMKQFYDFLFLGIKENLQHLYEEPENIQTIIFQHNEIYEAIRDRDQGKAFDAMQTHIQFVKDFVRSLKSI